MQQCAATRAVRWRTTLRWIPWLSMASWHWLLVALGVTLVTYAVFIMGLLLAGRRGDARALATFIPDCLVLFRALVRDPRVPTGRKLLLGALLVYLAMPIDL